MAAGSRLAVDKQSYRGEGVLPAQSTKSSERLGF